jgi:RNA polymerase sigma-70 factor (ECF subfamily)
MKTLDATPPFQTPPDEELMHQLAAGRQDALGPLYTRYARLIFNVAAHSLDRPAAEEVVQDVFLAVWRKAAVFSPERGAFRPWVMQIAHYRILNELRRRSRHPQPDGESNEERLAGLRDRGPQPDEAAWRETLRQAVRAALQDLPPSQREAVDLAFFEDKTHEQVASELNLPLGTAKTRIRSGLAKLRGRLAPLAAGVAVLAFIIAGGLGYRAEYASRQQDDRALALLTESTAKAMRLVAWPGIPPQSHGEYHGAVGARIAILTVSNLPAVPDGETYWAWAEYRGTWRSLGAVRPDSRGHARLIVEGTEFAVLPETVEVTLERTSGGLVPQGPVVISWPAR